MNIVLNTNQSYKLSELAKAVENSSDDLFYVVKTVDGNDVSYAITREQLIQGISGGGSDSRFIISGGVVWTGAGLVFDVSPINYNFYGTTNTTPATQLTLDSGDSDPRFDAFVVDVSTNTVVVIKGTPAADPLIPAIGDDQVFIQATFIGAGATTPTITNDFVYRDNADWTTSTYTVGSPSPGTVDFESTNDPFEGTFCIDSNTSRSTGLRFQRVGSINLGNDTGEFSNLSFRIRFDTALPSNRNLLSSVWLSGSTVGNTVNFSSFGIDRNLVGEWQTIVLPTSVFNASEIDRIQIRMDGGNNTQQVEYFLDYIVFATGVIAPTQLPKITIQDGGTTIGSRPKLNFIEGTNVTFDIVDDAINDRVNITMNSGGVGGAEWGSITGTLSDQTDLQTALNGKVATAGNESIDGIKTFTSFPITPSLAPTTDFQTANKKYVDDNAGTTDHAALNNLAWTLSGHTGTANRVPVFGAGGAAEEAQTTGNDAKLVSGTEGTNGNLVEWAASGNARDSGLATGDVIVESDITGTTREYTAGQGFEIEDLTITAGTPNIVNWSVDGSNMKRLVLNADAELQVPTGSINAVGRIEVQNSGGFTLTFAAGLSADFIVGDTPTTTDTEYCLINYDRTASRTWLVVTNQNP